MPILEKFTKQPADVQDYDIDFTEWLNGLTDIGVSHVASASLGITLQSSVLSSGIVKVWLAGGMDGESYKITVTLTTAAGRIKQAEIIIKVKEF